MHRVWRGRERTIRDGSARAVIFALVASLAAIAGSSPGVLAARQAPPSRDTARILDAVPPRVSTAPLADPLEYRCGERAEPRFQAVTLRGAGIAQDEGSPAGAALLLAIDGLVRAGWNWVAMADGLRWAISPPTTADPSGPRWLVGVQEGDDGTWSTIVRERCRPELAVDGARSVPWTLVPEGWLTRAPDTLDVMVAVPCIPAGEGRFVRFAPGPVASREQDGALLVATSIVPDGTRPRCLAGATMRQRLPLAVQGRPLVDIARPQWATRWGPALEGTTPAPATPSLGPWPGPVRDLAYQCDGGGPVFRGGWTQQIHDAQARDDEIGAIIRRWISTETAWPAVGYRVAQVGPDELHVLGGIELRTGPWWVDATIERTNGVWQEISGYGECRPTAVARDNLYLTWTLDPAYPVRRGDRVLHLRLTLPRCFEDVYPVDWSPQPPIVREDGDAVYLVIGARQRDADRCRDELVIRQTARLSRPLGDRAVVDANQLPPRTIGP